MASILRDSEGRLRTAWRFAFFLVGLVVVHLATAVILGIILGLTGMVGPRTELEDILHVVALAMIAITGLVFLWVASCRHALDRRSLGSLGLRASGRDLAVAAVGGTAAGGGLVAVTLALLCALGAYTYAGRGDVSDTVILTIALPFAAFSEEIICRGYLLQNMREVGRPVAGVVVSSVIFAVLHSLNPGAWFSVLPMLALFLTGVVFALTYLLSGNVWFPTALHFAWNGMEGPVLGTPISGLEVNGLLRFQPAAEAAPLLTGGDFGIEGSLLIVPVQCAVIALLLVLLWRRRTAARPAGSALDRGR